MSTTNPDNSIKATKRRNNRMFIFYIISLAVAVFAAWLYGRSADQYVEDVRVEAQNKLTIETEKVRTDAANELKIKTEEVRAEARQEEIRIENEGKERVEKVKAESGEKIAALNKEAEFLRAEAERAREGIATAQATAATANATAEKERLTRIELEASLAPRTLSGTEKTIERLKQFAGMPYLIEYAPDAEAERTAGQVNFILGMADWKFLDMHPSTGIPDGMFVESTIDDPAESTPARQAMYLFAEYLEANGLYSTARPILKIWPSARGLPDGTVRVRVGFKPAPYFMEKLDKLDSNLSERQRQMMEENKREDKKRRERLSQEWFLPPQEP